MNLTLHCKLDDLPVRMAVSRGISFQIKIPNINNIEDLSDATDSAFGSLRKKVMTTLRKFKGG